MVSNANNVLYYCFLFLTWLISLGLLRFFIKCNTKTTINNTIPTPPGLPIIGHIHMMSHLIHNSFHSLATRYGPLLQLHMGASTMILVSDSNIAKEMLKTHEINFLSRPNFGLMEYSIYKDRGLFASPYGEHYKFLKKLCMTKALSSGALNKFKNIREDEVNKLLGSLVKMSFEKVSCDLSVILNSLTNNIICRIVMSTRCSGNENEAKEVKGLIDDVTTISGKLSLGDVFGRLGKYLLVGQGRKLYRALLNFDEFMEKIIIQKYKEKGSETKDLMDILLECHDDPDANEINLSRTDIKGFLMEMMLGGTGTSATTLQWAMAELINNPQTMQKLKHEILSVVGTNRLLTESDIPNLPYLQAVVKETLRLRPPLVILMRECEKDINVCDFELKAKSRVMFNIYTIMRDPKSWDNPNDFLPERFIMNHAVNANRQQVDSKISMNYDYLPFGSGRRACPGASLALLVLHSVIGVLVQCFEWKMKNNEKVDMTEGFEGLSITMKNSFVCYPILEVFNPFVKQ